jgi:hypothetical protein
MRFRLCTHIHTSAHAHTYTHMHATRTHTHSPDFPALLCLERKCLERKWATLIDAHLLPGQCVCEHSSTPHYQGSVALDACMLREAALIPRQGCRYLSVSAACVLSLSVSSPSHNHDHHNLHHRHHLSRFLSSFFLIFLFFLFFSFSLSLSLPVSLCFLSPSLSVSLSLLSL